MLANIECMQMQSKCAHLQNEWIQHCARDAPALRGSQGGTPHFKVVETIVS